MSGWLKNGRLMSSRMSVITYRFEENFLYWWRWRKLPIRFFVLMEVLFSIPIGFSGKEFFNASNRDILQSVWRYTWVDRYPRWFAFCLSIKVQKYRYWFVCRIRSKSTKNVFPASFLITFVHSAFDGTANIVTESNSVNTSAIERSIFRPKCHYC